MAAASTPTNFNVQVGNANAFLSWDQISGATGYVVQRSEDNVTFADLVTIGGSPLRNQYLDAGVNVGGPDVNTSYWYQVKATNVSGDSAYCTSAQGIVVDYGIASLGYMRLQAQERADMVNSTFLSKTEWNRIITQSCKQLYDLLMSKYGDEYYLQNTYTWTTSGADQLYPFPPDFYKSFLVEVALNPNDPNSWITLRQYQRIQQNLWNYPNVYTFYGITNLRYRFTGNNLQIVPLAQAGQTIRMWYAPRPATLMADTDVFDGISGWEEYVIVRSAIKACIKEETDCSDLKQELKDLEDRIEAIAENRNVGEPQTVSDSKMRNFGWSSDDGQYGGSGGGGAL